MTYAGIISVHFPSAHIHLCYFTARDMFSPRKSTYIGKKASGTVRLDGRLNSRRIARQNQNQFHNFFLPRLFYNKYVL
jgi:hypothetical protein